MTSSSASSGGVYQRLRNGANASDGSVRDASSDAARASSNPSYKPSLALSRLSKPAQSGEPSGSRQAEQSGNSSPRSINTTPDANPSLIAATGEGEQEPATKAREEERVTWTTLPRKDQLVILALARLSEPLTQTSLQAYMFYQLRSFDPTLSDSVISFQAGTLQGAFTATQFVTAMLWGRAADSEWVGRKKVILIGLLGTTISVIGFGFSKSFASAVIFRCLGGALNGNVGVMRTLISEIIKEKKFQSRAFLLLPMMFNIGVIIGPILGGLLADPIKSYPNLFGKDSLFGGKGGVAWMAKWPYALPNLLNAVFLVCSSLAIIFGLEETLDALQDRPDYGLKIGRWISKTIFQRRLHQEYVALREDDTDISSTEIEMQTTPVNSTFTDKPTKSTGQRKLPLRRIWTRNLLLTFLAHGLMSMHIGTLNSLWFVFLSTPRFDPAHPSPPEHTAQKLPIKFTGGLGLPPARIGVALAILGVIGIILQLFLYPWLSAKLGTVRSYRLALSLFPVAYAMIPFLAVIPSTRAAPAAAAGPLVWAGIAGVLLVVVTGRTFALPASTILVNNCCPHPSVLGTVHGLGQSVSSGARTIGPMGGGWAFGVGLRLGVVGLAWWGLACMAVVGVVAAAFVRESSGHEIVLPGDDEE